MASPPDFQRFLGRLAEGLATRHLPFMLIGGQAVLLHGRPRLTEGVDISLGVGPDQLPVLLDVCSILGLIPLPEDPAHFVEETWVLPAHDASTGMRVDFIFSSTPYEHLAIGRSVKMDLAGVPIPFASAEDLIILKLFAGRARDREDAESVVQRKGKDLDWVYLEHWVRHFAAHPGKSDLLEQLVQLRRQERA